ncbi:hypothetical protein M9H77_07582 [Catharanthus roseus]|uniref:Uncharacterized protein n=1 Tax=Catharanthus roseus TaxID=4058 RepID=A0ACC0BVK9_CATRO|nr:hypothetical protein M9H77_07582 [Catharanthus roseus]
MEPSIVEEAPKVKELSQAKIEESLKLHVIEETSNEDPCCITNENNIEIKEKERMEEKERLNFGNSSKDKGGKLAYKIPIEKIQDSWKYWRMFYKFAEDTKNHFERLEGQRKPITKKIQNHNRKAKIEPTGNNRPPPYQPRFKLDTLPLIAKMKHFGEMAKT